MENNIFGYLIGSDIQLDIANKRLVNTSVKQSRYDIKVITLRDTMLRLLVTLLHNADGSIITHDAIISHVWESYGLASSSQRIWKVMQALMHRLQLIGAPTDFIIRIDKKGYYVKESEVTLLYFIPKVS